jgi:hypothetical protein
MENGGKQETMLKKVFSFGAPATAVPEDRPAGPPLSLMIINSALAMMAEEREAELRELLAKNPIMQIPIDESGSFLLHAACEMKKVSLTGFVLTWFTL